ncbi:amidase [Granulicella sibirica]|uniref:Amidotransferase n=1 Tax=Granulicella sibirica TaxID=2479048 RepID=A0A4Q0T514_9BACT|nr:amidase [Granulicella sibirica]RXH58062.1 amidotransferase [Granulicella sibirica]
MIDELRLELDAGADPVEVAMRFADRANGIASRNTYLHFDRDEAIRQAEALAGRFPDVDARPPLYGVPVSIKDCFDVAGTRTTFGSRFYERTGEVASADSAMAQRLRDAGCVITGKTHLQALAYGITGENPEYGDCVQPRDASLLTGGSSSGAAASVQEGSAVAAIGTDTGGSIRVPAALCGLVGYRCSHSIASTWWPEVWQGARHLARSFDTPGVLFRDLKDLSVLAEGIFGVPAVATPAVIRVGCVAESFLSRCDAEVIATYRQSKERWQRVGAEVEEFDASEWEGSVAIFSGIQAHEAAAIHRGHYDEFDAEIAARLKWGASLTDEQVTDLLARLAVFRERMTALMARFDLLMLPCAPMSRLVAGEDHTAIRPEILRYTTPFSLAGLPVVALPGENFGTGMQIATAPGEDAKLIALIERFTS